MHMATAIGLMVSKENDSIDEITRNIAVYYKKSVNDMKGRAPGKTTIAMLEKLK